MTRLTWDDLGDRVYETGVDRGVVYPAIDPGVPWNGLTSIEETDDGGNFTVSYVDGIKLINQIQLGQYTAQVKAFTYPDELMPYDGYSGWMTGQKRGTFNLSYRSLIGNDVEGLSYGYRLHLIYNCLLAPTNRNHESLNDTSDISDFEWKLSTIPSATPYDRPASHFFMQTDTIEQGALAAIENILYGQEGIDPRMPTIAEVLAIFEANAIFTVVDNGDGTVTITGPDDWVFPVGSDQLSISSPSFNQIDDVHILARSY